MYFIPKDKNGKKKSKFYYYRYDYKDEHGRWRQKTMTTNCKKLRDAKELIKKLFGDKESSPIVNRNKTFDELATEYIRTTKNQVSFSTKKPYIEMFETNPNFRKSVSNKHFTYSYMENEPHLGLYIFRHKPESSVVIYRKINN